MKPSETGKKCGWKWRIEVPQAAGRGKKLEEIGIMDFRNKKK